MRTVLFLAIAAGALAAGCGDTFVATGGAGGSGGSGGSGLGGSGAATTGTAGGSGGSGGSTATAGSGGTGPGGSTVGGSGGTGGSQCSPLDQDGDGWSGCEGDCDDADKATHPGADELCDNADNDCGGDGEKPECFGVYVATNGSDADPGTKEKPFQTIQHGVDVAVQLGTPVMPTPVFVAKGEYFEQVVLGPNVHVQGDCSAETWACGDARASTIFGPAEGAVYAGPEVNGDTSLEGFTIKSDASSDGPSVGVEIVGSGPKIRGNTILPGECEAEFEVSVGVRVDAASAVPEPVRIIDNTIIAAQASFASIGVWLRTPHLSTEVTRNKITAGQGLFSQGIGITDCGPLSQVKGNDIQAGAGTIGQFIDAEPGSSWAIVVGAGKVDVDGNQINPNNQPDLGFVNVKATCSAPVTCGGIIATSDRVTIRNNVVYGAISDGAAGIALVEREKDALALDQVKVTSNYVSPTGHPLPINGDPVAGSVSACFVLFTDYQDEVRPIGKIRNNICVGGTNALRYGILEGGIEGVPTDPTPSAFTNNDVFLPLLTGTSAFAYHDVSTSGMNDLLPGNVNLIPNASNNFTGAPQFASGKLSVASPCVNAGTPEDAPDHDREGQMRPMGIGFDVGPDEVL